MRTSSEGAKAPRHDSPVAVITPRALREHNAAAYLGFSSSYLRNQRVADMRAIANGQPIQGPRWVHIGTAVRYLREDLDAWIDSFRLNPWQGGPALRGEP